MAREGSITRWTSAGLVVLLVMAGCRADETADERRARLTRPPRIAVDAGSVEPAGTELAPGIEVQPGSSLIAGTFPKVEVDPPDLADREPVGWQAVIVVEGDPVEVWDRYAAAMGVADVGSAVDSCIVASIDIDWTEPPDQPWSSAEMRFLTEHRWMGGENTIECEVEAGPTYMTMTVGVQRSRCGGHREGCELDVDPISHLFLGVVPGRARDEIRLGTDWLRSYRSRPESPSVDRHGSPLPHYVPAGEVDRPSIGGDDAVSRLPLAGEPFDDSLVGFLTSYPGRRQDINRVPDGGRSLVAPAMVLDCHTGLVAVLRVPGSANEAVATFLDPVDVEARLDVVEGTDEQDREWAASGIETPGGYHLDIVAVADGERSSTVLLTECDD